MLVALLLAFTTGAHAGVARHHRTTETKTKSRLIARDRRCGPPCGGGKKLSDCHRDLAGTWSDVSTLAACTELCQRCDQCRFVSYSARQRECQWNRHCAPQTTFAKSHRSFHAYGVRRGAHAYNMSTGISSYTSFVAPLDTTMLSDGILGAQADPRLSCFMQTAARRPVTIGALGGSITAGSGLNVASRGGGPRWLYPKRLVAWLAARWPHQANASLLNLGIPGTGPTMFALCLQSLLAAPPDLVLLEFGINAAAAELRWFEVLLRVLRRAQVDPNPNPSPSPRVSPNLIQP